MLTLDQTEQAEFLMAGLADLVVVQHQNMFLCTYPLGACLGIAIHDPTVQVAGVLHSLLPDSSIDAHRAATRPGMFLDTGLAELLKRAYELNATRENLLVYVAGGGRILDETTFFNIGRRNHEVLTSLLGKHALNIQAQEVGGFSNRSLQINPVTGEVRLRISGQPKVKILCKPLTTT